MKKLQHDFLGPFVETNGQINRPEATTALKISGKLVVKNIIYTPRCKVIDEAGTEEQWHSCGEVVAYKEARETLTQAEFEHFAAMACGPSFAWSPQAKALYPQMAKLYPRGIDYLSSEYKAHSQLSDALRDAVYARRSAEYKAKLASGIIKPASGPAPTQLKVTSMDEVMRDAVAKPQRKVRP